MKYTPEKIKEICGYLAEGRTRTDAAKLAGIHIDTFYEWLNTKSDFSDAVKVAEEKYAEWERNELVSSCKKSLKDLILGCTTEEVVTEYIADPSNPSQPKIKHQIRKEKHNPPSATAIIFALCNRDPDNWKNRISNEVTGKLETKEDSNLNLANIPDELLEQVVKAIKGE